MEASSAHPVGPQASPTVADRIGAGVAQRPEAAVGAAFAGGLVLAIVLKRLAS
jgi:hypothetical protein